jgi:hypothetical protein
MGGVVNFSDYAASDKKRAVFHHLEAKFFHENSIK